jgi:hypothetical protein
MGCVHPGVGGGIPLNSSDPALVFGNPVQQIFKENKYEVICFLLISYMLQIRLTYMWVTAFWFDSGPEVYFLSIIVLRWVVLVVSSLLLILQV